MVVISSQLVKMEMSEVEMGNDTRAGQELWEGPGVEDEEGMDKEHVDRGEGKKGVENVGEDLVSEYFF